MTVTLGMQDSISWSVDNMRTGRCDIAVTLCMLGSFSKYILFAVFFLQNECFHKILSEILPIDLVLKSLDPDQARQFVGISSRHWQVEFLSECGHRSTG